MAGRAPTIPTHGRIPGVFETHAADPLLGPRHTLESEAHPGFVDPQLSAQSQLKFDEDVGLGPSAHKAKVDHAKSTSLAMRAYPQTMAQQLNEDGFFGPDSVLAPGIPSPLVVGVGDFHPGNTGTFQVGHETVFGVSDTSKARTARAEHDVERLGATTIAARWDERGKTGTKNDARLADATFKAYVAELRRFAAGADLPAYLRRGDVKSQSIRDLIDAGAAANTPKGEKELLSQFVSGKNEKRFQSRLRVTGETRNRIEDAFSSYVKSLPANGPKIDKVLDFGASRTVGGTGSGFDRYFVLARVTERGQAPRTICFELKQLVPMPADGTGKLTPVDGERVVQDTAILRGKKDALFGATRIADSAREVRPYRAGELDFSPKGLSINELLDAAHDEGTLAARVHAQSMHPSAAQAWLDALGSSRGEDKFEKSGQRFAGVTQKLTHQAEYDRVAANKLLKKQS